MPILVHGVLLRSSSSAKGIKIQLVLMPPLPGKCPTLTHNEKKFLTKEHFSFYEPAFFRHMLDFRMYILLFTYRIVKVTSNLFFSAAPF